MNDADDLVVLTPGKGDGRLTGDDVDVALDGLPRGGEVVVLVDEADDFSPEAPFRLARALSGCVVRHRFGPKARRISGDWLALYRVASAQYLAVEARLLGR